MDDRKHDESMLDWARRLHEQVADLRGKLDHERQLREETVAMQAREIQRLRHELRAEGISERIVMGPGITVEGYGHTYRYVRDKPAQAESEKAAGSDLQADPVVGNGLPGPHRRAVLSVVERSKARQPDAE